MPSPAAWLERLERQLDARWYGGTVAKPSMGTYDAYYEGDHRLTFATYKFREAFGALFGTLADNWCPIVVDAATERLSVEGFRFGDNQEADSDAWDVWQANGLDAEADMLHTEAVKLGEAYWLVEPNGELPRISAEHPQQMIVQWAPGNRKQRLAALKKWVDYDGFAYATLYLPDQIVKYRSKFSLREGGLTGGRINWVRKPGDSGGPNPLGEVPVVPMCNAPNLLRGGQSDLKSAIPVQNAINKLVCDLLIGSEYQAFPQRVLMGVDLPRDPDTGQPTRAAEMKASQQRLWVIPGADGKVAEFSASDLKNYREAIDGFVRDLTAQTRTPPHYVAGQIVNASGDALKAAETGLVAKVRKKMKPFGEGHEEAMRLAFRAMGDTAKANETKAETIWKDPESRSQAEVVDAATKLATLGVPHEVIWEKVGFSPQEIDRMRGMEEVEQLLRAALQPTAPPQNGATPAPSQAAPTASGSP